MKGEPEWPALPEVGPWSYGPRLDLRWRDDAGVEDVVVIGWTATGPGSVRYWCGVGEDEWHQVRSWGLAGSRASARVAEAVGWALCSALNGRFYMVDVREELCRCGHQRGQHIYNVGPCRPGYRCATGCQGFVEVGERPNALDPLRIEMDFPCTCGHAHDAHVDGHCVPVCGCSEFDADYGASPKLVEHREPVRDAPSLAESLARIAEDVHVLATPVVEVSVVQRGQIFMARMYEQDDMMRFESDGEPSMLLIPMEQWREIGEPDLVVVTVEAR